MFRTAKSSRKRYKLLDLNRAMDEPTKQNLKLLGEILEFPGEDFIHMRFSVLKAPISRSPRIKKLRSIIVRIDFIKLNWKTTSKSYYRT
jgi:hypothetical protein